MSCLCVLGIILHVYGSYLCEQGRKMEGENVQEFYFNYPLNHNKHLDNADMCLYPD